MCTKWPAHLGVSAPDTLAPYGAQDPSLLPFTTWSETPAPPLDLTPHPRAYPRLPRPAASPYYPADRSLHKYSECAFAIPLFSIMSFNTSALSFLHLTQSTRHHPPTHWSSQRHVASGKQVPSSSVSSGPKPRHTSSQVPSPPKQEHKPKYGHGHGHEYEHEHEHEHARA